MCPNWQGRSRRWRWWCSRLAVSISSFRCLCLLQVLLDKVGMLFDLILGNSHSQKIVQNMLNRWIFQIHYRLRTSPSMWL